VPKYFQNSYRPFLNLESEGDRCLFQLLSWYPYEQTEKTKNSITSRTHRERHRNTNVLVTNVWTHSVAHFNDSNPRGGLCNTAGQLPCRAWHI